MFYIIICAINQSVNSFTKFFDFLPKTFFSKKKKADEDNHNA